MIQILRWGDERYESFTKLVFHGVQDFMDKQDA